VTGFRVEQNGQRTATPNAPSTALDTKVKFSVTDDGGVSSVSLAWRPADSSEWTTMPLSLTGAEYSTPFELEGAIDLQLIATDTSGNTVQEEWAPAVITKGTPMRPRHVIATRTGTNAISVSWSASWSAVGISHYRIERLPGGQVFTTTGPQTTFLDTSGLVAGSAYFYRVTAVDNRTARSLPSKYDVATLIALETIRRAGQTGSKALTSASCAGRSMPFAQRPV
jgi:hypothetical protein